MTFNTRNAIDAEMAREADYLAREDTEITTRDFLTPGQCGSVDREHVNAIRGPNMVVRTFTLNGRTWVKDAYAVDTFGRKLQAVTVNS